MSDMHAQQRVGNKVCMVDHYHQGTSSGRRTKEEAMSAAIRSWQDFTAWEYGSAWGSWGASAGKGASCGQSGGGWGCDISSRPCRSAGGRARR